MSYHIFEFLDYFTINYNLLELSSSLTCFLSTVVEKIKPVKTYNSLKEDRLQLIKEQKDKTGVYCLVNLINGHTYIGSSVNIEKRMKNYLNNSFIKSKKNSNMPITKALSKYGQEHFAVLIVDYVDIKTFNYTRNLLYKESITLL
jgi:hypothetical protein